MATLNDYGDDSYMDEGPGDAIYDEIEQKAKDGAKDAADAAGDLAVNALDKATDQIKPVKELKDKVKEKLSNNPITRIKAAIKRVKDKIRQAARKLASQGIRAVGHAAVAATKGLVSFAAAHPLIAAVIVIIIIVILAFMDPKNEDNVDHLQTDEFLQENPYYANLDGMSDDDIVVTLMGDCVDQQYDSMDELIKMTLEKEEQAKDIYSVFHNYGFNNASIAGILANMDVESGLDPSAIEGIFSEYGVLGTKKAAALTSIPAYTEFTLFPLYKKSGISINRNGYKTTNEEGQTVYYCGLGFVQWTGENAKTLMTAAENLDIEWYNKEFQLGYMISDCMYRPGFFAGWLGSQEPDYSFDKDDYDPNDYASEEAYDDAVSEAKENAMKAVLESAKKSAVYFAHNYEGNTSSDEKRQNAALIWYATIFNWCNTASDNKYEDDSDAAIRYEDFSSIEYSDSVNGLANDLAAIINFIDIEEAQYRCLAGNVYDNSSLSAAQISLAWPKRELSFNNGTNLYQTVLRTIWPRNYTYKACDRTVACAVVWSGTDVNFPLGNTNTQFRYMETSPKWERVGTSDSLSVGDLQPGDIFVLNGHTFMYVSQSAVQASYLNEAYPESDSVSGSLGKRSPACDSSASSIINRGGQDWEGRGVYTVFRCCDPDNSDKWKSVGAGMTRDD